MLWCLWCNHACNLSDATMRDLLDTSMDTASGHQNGAGGVFSGSVCSCPAWGLRGLWAVLVMIQFWAHLTRCNMWVLIWCGKGQSNTLTLPGCTARAGVPSFERTQGTVWR